MVCCPGGNRSNRASEELVTLDYNNIVAFVDINDWLEQTVTG